MANKKNLWGMLVMVLVFGMTVVGCGEKEEEKGNGNIPGGGKFTLTGIPSTYNGMYALFASGWDAKDLILFGAQSVSSFTKYTAARISNGSVTLTLWKATNDVISGYTGNDTVIGQVMIFEKMNDDEEPAILCDFSSITFTNGNATKTWSEGTTTTP